MFSIIDKHIIDTRYHSDICDHFEVASVVLFTGQGYRVHLEVGDGWKHDAPEPKIVPYAENLELEIYNMVYDFTDNVIEALSRYKQYMSRGNTK